MTYNYIPLPALLWQEISPISFIRKIRLHKAKVLLQTTDLSIAEIAYDLGFTDPNYFSRAFNKEFEEAPSTLRK